MVKTIYYKTTQDGEILVKTYSTNNFYLLKKGKTTRYGSAVDLGYYDLDTNEYKPLYEKYTETNILIESEE